MRLPCAIRCSREQKHVAEQEFQPQERLHALSWLFGLATLIRQFLFPLIAAALFGWRDGAPPWLALLILPMLGFAILQQYFYRYGLGPSGLVIREGLFFQNIRQIDYARIENVDTERGVLHRLFGVAQVHVETSTGGKPEATISVLSVRAADALRERIFAARAGSSASSTAAVEPAQQEEVLLHLPVQEVVKFGLIDNRGIIVVAGLFGLLHESGLFERWAAGFRDRISLQAFDELVALGWAIHVTLAASVLMAAILALRLLSVALALVTLHDFRLVRVGSDFKVRYGLLTRVAGTLRLARVQAVHQTEGVLHRWFKRVSVRLDLAGDGSEAPQEGSGKVRWLAPIAPPARAHELIAVALPDVDLDAPLEWRPLAPRARRRIFKRNAVICTLLALSLTAVLRSYTPVLIALIGVPLSWVHATMYVRHTRWALQSDVLQFRRGWLTRKLVIVPRNRIQCVRLGESPFDRRNAMASVSIDTAGSGLHSEIVRVPYLELDVARELAAALYSTAAQEPAPVAQGEALAS